MAKLSFVLDASGINRSSLDYSAGGFGIPQSVLSELRGETARTAVEEGIRNGSIKILSFGQKSADQVMEAAKATGDASSLSRPDLDVLAAAIEHGLTIISDDYAIQNTASKLGLKVSGTSQDTIRRQVTWVWSCGGCGKKADGPGTCQVCGHKARKRPG